MATLHFSPSLSLDLMDAAEKQRNGEPHVLGSNIPVTAHFYDKVFNNLLDNKDLKRVLRKLTSKNLEQVWKERIDPTCSGIYIQEGSIRVTPCIKVVTDDGLILVAIPFYIEGATSNQIEQVLKACLSGGMVDCVGNELRVVINIKNLQPDR